MLKSWKLICFTIIISILVSACGGSAELPSSIISSAGFELNPVFKPLAEKLGVSAGVVISESFQNSGVEYQYTSQVLFTYDPNAELTERLSLFPLARIWQIEEPAVEDPQNPDKVYANGHIIWDEVVPFYMAWGADVLGKPLTEVRYNPNYGRYEQFFENMGFYRKENSPVGQVSILPYGTWACAGRCKPEKIDNTIPSPHPESPTTELLLQAEAIFWQEVTEAEMRFTGFPLTPAYQAPDGYIEKVFENVVMIWDPVRGGAVDLRRLPQEAGIAPMPPVPPNNTMTFFPVMGDLGYNIPGGFEEYILQHGTMARVGQPITEVFSVTGSNTSRQCFEKICLVFDQTAPDSLKFRPLPLGYQYSSVDEQPVVVAPVQPEPAAQVEPVVQAEPAAQVEPVVQAEPDVQTDTIVQMTGMLPVTAQSQLRLTIWEGTEFPLQTESQLIGASVFDGITPLSGANILVTVTLPDGTQRTYPMPLTGADGVSQVTLEPIAASKGTLIPYQVCIINLPDSQFCTGDEYIIWE